MSPSVCQPSSARAVVSAHGRPPLFGAFTRVYFEFHPVDARASVLTCHVDRRMGESMASLPAVGTTVRVKYLPERPSCAVIAKLVSRFVD